MKFDRIIKIDVLTRKVYLFFLDFAGRLKSRFGQLISCCFLCVAPLFGQQLKFKQITDEDGLSTNHVNCLLEDDLGFLWFGTQDGLNKYDGYQLRIYRNEPGNPASIPSNCVRTAIQFRRDLIVLGTRDGIAFLNPMTEVFSPAAKNQFELSSPVNALLKYDEETFLVANDQGLFSVSVLSGKVTKVFFPNETMKINDLLKLDRTVYVATEEQGLWSLAAGTYLKHLLFSTEDLPKELKMTELPKAITAVGCYGGKLYLGTRSSGVYKTSLKHEILAHIKTDNPKLDAINDFVFWNNRLFAATEGGLVVHQLLNKQFRVFTKSEEPMALNSAVCTSILADQQNNLWIGTSTGGINISFFRSQKFPLNSDVNESEDRRIYCFAEPEPDVLLIGGENYLAEVDLRSGNKKIYQQALKNSTPLCLYAENKSAIWIGTQGQGLVLLNRETGKVQKILDPLIAETVTDLKSDGQSWLVATMGDGLFVIDPKTKEYRQFTEFEGLLSPNLNSIFIDHSRRLWLATNDQGLLRYKLPLTKQLIPDKIFQNCGRTSQIASNMILSVAEDETGSIWAATSAGLSRLLPGDTFQNYYNKDGLANTFLYTLLRDSLGDMWASSNGGLIRFNPRNPPTEVSFPNYNVKDGLQNNEYCRGAAMARKNGSLIFGGALGYNIFRPSQIKDNLHAPQIVLVSYKRAGKEVATDSLITYKKNLKLGAKENFLQFELAALDYTDPSKNKFRYMLEGYDADWSEPTTVRYISYTDLPGGSYRFKVKAANNDGIWNEKALELAITVVPPFWQSKSFYLMVIILLLTLVYAFTQFRTRVVLRENRILEERVAARTKELEEKNRDITSSIEYARRIQDAILPSRDYIFNALDNAFILYQPKDIVSGDFYWFAEQNGVNVFAVVDCTGHGVPGAFMSMIGHNLLHQIVSEKRIIVPGKILDHLHLGIQLVLRQGRNEIQTNDGMDVSIICLHPKKQRTEWAGANRPLILLNPQGEMFRVEGDKFPVGGVQFEQSRTFTTQQITAEKGSMAYLFSDGYADQFGGERGKKFMLRRFHALLGDIHYMSADEQQQALRRTFEDWKQNHEQVDDVLIVGIQL